MSTGTTVGARQPTVGALKAARGGVTSRQVGRAVGVAALSILTLVFSLPTIWMILTSVKTAADYSTYPIIVVSIPLQFVNYQLAVTIFPFAVYLLHSVVLAGSFTVLTVVTSSMAGFAFSRHRGVPGRNALFAVVLATMMVPGLVTVVPQYMLFAKLNLLNSYWPWILWGISGSAFHIFLFRQFFLNIPKELEDAAEVDGCNKFRIFWQIFLPNSLPVIATSAIFSFSWVWGDWLFPELFLNDSITTLAVKLATAYVDPQGNVLTTVTMAGVLLYVLPLVVVFFVAQKYIIQGIVTTGLKG